MTDTAEVGQKRPAMDEPQDDGVPEAKVARTEETVAAEDNGAVANGLAAAPPVADAAPAYQQTGPPGLADTAVPAPEQAGQEAYIPEFAAAPAAAPQEQLADTPAAAAPEPSAPSADTPAPVTAEAAAPDAAAAQPAAAVAKGEPGTQQALDLQAAPAPHTQAADAGGAAAGGAAAATGGASQKFFHGSAGSNADPNAPLKLPADAVLKQEIPMPRRMASCVIGIKGATVTKLRRESATRIHVRQGQQGEADQVVEIEGPIENVVNCMRLIEDMLAKEDPAYRMTPKPVVSSRFQVTPDMIGPAIIGKGGTHAKHVRDRTGVRIEVERIPDIDSRQTIVLTGKADAVREAYHILLGNIRKYLPNLAAGIVPPAGATVPRSNYGTTRGGASGSGAGGGQAGGRSTYSSGGGGERRSGGYSAPPPPPRGYGADRYGAAAAYQPPPPARAADPYAAYAAPAAAAPGAVYGAPPPAAAAAQSNMIYIMGPNGQLIPAVVSYGQSGTPTATAAPAGAAAAPPAAAYAAAPATSYQQVVYAQPGAATSPATAPYTIAAGGDAAAAAAAAVGSYLPGGMMQQAAPGAGVASAAQALTADTSGQQAAAPTYGQQAGATYGQQAAATYGQQAAATYGQQAAATYGQQYQYAAASTAAPTTYQQPAAAQPAAPTQQYAAGGYVQYGYAPQ